MSIFPSIFTFTPQQNGHDRKIKNDGKKKKCTQIVRQKQLEVHFLMAKYGKEERIYQKSENKPVRIGDVSDEVRLSESRFQLFSNIRTKSRLKFEPALLLKLFYLRIYDHMIKMTDLTGHDRYQIAYYQHRYSISQRLILFQHSPN